MMSSRHGCWLLLAVLTATYCHGLANKCKREPPLTVMPKTPGDNGFKIVISGNPEKYVPGELYTVSLKGWRSKYSVLKFTGFMLVLDSSVSKHLYGPTSVGSFQLYGDVLTRHSDDCPNAITQTSNNLKSEIQVLWTAPPAGSGCVRFRATVVAQRDEWYMDDGELTKELCEEEKDGEDIQPEIIKDCCACDEAKYEVTFEGLWSRHTHPKDFPANEWLTHFSDIIGASHSADYKVWEYGGYASDGLRQVAEWGSTRTLESELKRQSDHIRTIIKARGLWYPNVNGKTFAVFRVDNRHHLMSLVSMLGPSPDWIVGVSSLELCLNKNCSWVDEKTLNLYPYDAGTDSGVTYASANIPTIPRQKIRRITNSYPNNPKNPFYNTRGNTMKPLARLTVKRQRVYEKTCGYPIPLQQQNDEIEDAQRSECQVTDWSEFTPCSVSCGKGLRFRTRVYLRTREAEMRECRRQLEETEMCAAPIPICPGGNQDDFDGEHNEAKICKTTPWSSWTPCSVTCGKGFMTRSRKFLNYMGRKKCTKEHVDRQMCLAPVLECKTSLHHNQELNPECSVTQWTEWSPCSVTCGKGVKARRRDFLVHAAAKQAKCDVTTEERENCEGERRDCLISPSEAKEVCMQAKEPGPCRGYFPRYYYDTERKMCVQFVYGGCRGNRNNFEMYDECTRMCEMHAVNPTQIGIIPSDNHRIDRYPDHSDLSLAGGSHLPAGGHDPGTPRVKCQMSEWTEWSPCTKTCGRSHKEKRRMIKVHPSGGAKSCPSKMIKKKRCRNSKCEELNGGLKVMSQVFDPYLEYSSPILHPPQYHDPNYNPHDNGHDLSIENQLGLDESDNVKSDCVMGEWGPWSPCTHSCGSESLQQRARSIISKPRGGGTKCGPRLHRRYCTLPPCPHPSSRNRKRVFPYSYLTNNLLPISPYTYRG